MKKIILAFIVGTLLVSFTIADSTVHGENESYLILALTKTKFVGHIKANGELVLDGIKLPESAMIADEKYSLSEPRYISSKSDCGNYISFIATSEETGQQILFATAILTEENSNCPAISHVCKSENGSTCEFDYKDGSIWGCKNDVPGQSSDHTIANGELLGEVGDLFDIVFRSSKDI